MQQTDEVAQLQILTSNNHIQDATIILQVGLL